MKKTLIGALFLGLLSSSSLFADGEIYGEIIAVNPAKKTITLGGYGTPMEVSVSPYTEIKGDDCGLFGMDTYGTFRDLVVGRWVKIDGYPTANGYYGAGMPVSSDGQQQAMPGFMAHEIEYECRRMAY